MMEQEKVNTLTLSEKRGHYALDNPEIGADSQVSTASSYLEWLKDKLSFLPNLRINPLWLRDYEIFAQELSCN